MIFNGVKKTSDFCFLFKGEEIEITSTYTYLRVQFSGPRFSLRPTLQPQINKGYGSLALLERVLSPPLSGHLIQDEPVRYLDSTHCFIWIRNLGTLSTRVGLGLS